MANRTFSPRIKLMMSVAIPLLIMAVTLTMVGMSFAWFSKSSTITIEAIDLTTAPVFTLLFTAGGLEGGENEKTYKGQKGFDTADGHLITNEWAVSPDGRNYPFESDHYNSYIADAPFTIQSKIILSTENTPVSLNVFFDTMEITYTETDDATGNTTMTYRKRFGDTITGADGTTRDIGYGFTWYFTDEAKTVMYTPYGKINVADLAAHPLGASLPDKKPELENFTANGETFLFYVVFAPEKLYWMQYCSNWKDSLDFNGNSLYTNEEIGKIVDRDHGYTNQLYYSTPVYTGSDFVFSATIRVTKIGEETVS